MDAPPGGIFSGVDYTIIPGDGIDAHVEKELNEILQQRGATHRPLRPDGRVDTLHEHTHIISNSVDFPDYFPALDSNILVVRPSWVMSSVDKNRQSQTRQHSPDPDMFLSQVVLSCGDLPEGDKDAVIAGVLAMGGLYSSPLTRLVTHIVTLSAETDKCRMAMEKMPNCKIVLPHWLNDCFSLGKMINETPYRFPDPEILRSTSSGPVKIRPPHDMEGATSAIAGKVPTYRPATSPSQSRKELNVFKGKKLLFSHDLNINEHLAKTLQTIVEQAGGEMTTSVDECDTYIGHYRDGMDYIAAAQAEKEVANLAWFYNVINRNRWTNPISKLLHYPVPRGGIEGFRGLRISLSNYTGEARIYLENLVKEAGAEFTKTMKQDNTHLITAHKQSEKCDAAQEWDINIINHLWLEESYAKCAVQSLTHPRYTHFPLRTNLTEIVGQTTINLDIVRRLYFTTQEKTIRDLPPAQRNGSAPHPYRGALNPQRSPRKTVPASSAVPATAAAPADVDMEDAPTTEPMQTLHEGDEHEEEAAPPPQTAQKSRAREAFDVATPATKRTGEKENQTPPTTGRASKDRAINALQMQRDDIALFQKEMKRKGGVIRGGRRLSEDEPPESAKKANRGKKRTSGDAMDTDGDLDTGNEEEVAKATARQTKKARKSDGIDQPPVKYKLLVTADTRWEGKLKKEDADSRKLRSIGIELVKEPAECNMLCAPSMKRTRKFVASLATAPEVVDSAYLDHLLSIKNPDAMRDPSANRIVDRDFEEKYGLRLDESLIRAKENQRRLLRGWTIFFTEKIPGGFETWKEIVNINGGTAVLYRGRTGLTLPKPRIPPSKDPDAGAEAFNQGPDADDEVDVIYLVSGTDDEEVKLWKTFRATAEKQKLRPRIAGTEWVLHTAMSQRIEWDEKWVNSEDKVPGFKEKYGR